MASTIARLAYTGWMDVLSRLLCRLRTTWSTQASSSPFDSASAPVRAQAPHTDQSQTHRRRYWLPNIVKVRIHPLRFATRASYTKRRPSSASLLRRRRHRRLHALPHSPSRRCALPPAVAEGGTTFWTKVVGIDTVRASIACYSLCCAETGWKSCKPRQDGGSLSFLLSFGLCIGNWQNRDG